MAVPTRADLFARIWRGLEKNFNDQNDVAFRTAYDELRNNPDKSEAQIQGLTRVVAAGEVSQVEAELKAWASRQVGNGTFSPAALYIIAARALERWYDPLVAFADRHRSPAPGRVEAWASLVERGRLNDDPEVGSVILKRPKWGRWRDPLRGPGQGAGFRDIADFFGTLQLAPKEVKAGGPDKPEEERTVRLSYKMMQEDSLVADPRREEEVLVVGFAPLAEQPGDIAVTIRPRQDGPRFYDVVANDLADRASAAMRTLVREKGANVIIFPEMVVSSVTLDRIRNEANTLGSEAGSPLRLVVAGTTRAPGPQGQNGPPYNEAVLFNHRGEQIARQRKLHRWNLNSGLREIYGLQPDDGLPEKALLYEFIEPGDVMNVVESPRLGRLAVLICESLGRTQPGMWVLENMRLDWLFTPVLDRSLEEWRWSGDAGFRATRAGRCRVIVANSMALTLSANDVALLPERQKVPRALRGYPIENVGVGLCIDALDGEQSARCRLVNLRLHQEQRFDAGTAACSAVRWEVDGWPNIDLRRPDQKGQPPGLFGDQGDPPAAKGVVDPIPELFPAREGV